MDLRFLLQIAALLACLLLAGPAAAVVYCVNSASAIVNAYNSANGAMNGTVHDIRVRSGSYSFATHLSFSAGGDKEFSLTGGWNIDCSARTINAANTTFNGSGQSASGSQFLFSGNQRSFRIEGIRFQNFGSIFLFEPICPFGQSCPDTESVRVRYNHFRNGIYALIIANDAQTYTVSNNLFENLIGSSDSSVQATVNLSYANEDAVPQVNFNTLSLGCSGTKPGLRLHSEKSGSLLSHNILATSGCSDPLQVVSAENGKPWLFRNNLYPVANTGPAPAAGSAGNLIGVNPQFVSATDFHLRETAPVSPAINAGQTPVQASQGALSVPAQDLDGPAVARLIGSRYDMGAYESAINDASVITVTSTDDSGAGSLRSAINSANASPGLQKIQFNIPGGCTTVPHLITLQTPLPDITDSVEIDGYSEPETQPNTLTLGTDAVLCIVILAQSGTLAQALQVPDSAAAATSLSVKGIAFAGSTGFNGNFTVALRLRGGSNHLIQGNAFAGTGPGAIGPLGELNFGIQIRDSAQDATIGGSEPEHRNSFGAMASSAIVLNDASSGGHTIQNNYIGLSASGLAASPIGLNGLFASASPNVKILDNVISAIGNSAAISITGATATGYEIARNRLGTSASGIPTATFRNGTGISIAGGSGGHQIGGILSSSASNTITNSDGAGVLLTPTAGTGTTVRPNRIFANGVGGSGLGIDLGTLGALPNDAGDADGGPNNGQNKPVISDSLVNPDGSRQVSGSLNSQTGSYIIDVYRSPDCPGGRGNMLNLVATEFVTNMVGVVVFDLTVPAAGAPGVLTAVATRVSNGDSSEVSDCFLEQHQTVTAIVSDTPDPHQAGQGFVVTVQVSGSTGGIPTGLVTVVGGGGETCQATLNANAGAGVGSCQMSGNWFGSTSLQASYPGSASFLPSQDSEPHSGVAAITETTIVNDTPDPSEVGQPYPVVVAVRRQHDDSFVNAGTITVSDGTGQTCQSSVVVGSASCEITSVSVGNKTLTATYSGSAGELLGSSDTEPHTVVAAVTTTTITSDEPDPSVIGQPYTVSIAVTANPGAGAPIGSVSVLDGSGANCNITLAGGSGSCQLTSTTAGNKTLTASYAPGGQAFANSSDTEPHSVVEPEPVATTTTITSHTPNPSRVGEPYLVSVSVGSDGATPTGTVTINGSGGASCQAVLTNGTASCNLTGLVAGEPLLTACLEANASFAGSCDTEPHSVIKADTSLDALEFSALPILVGEPVQVSVTFLVVAPGMGSPTGTISVTASATEQCVITLPALACTLSFETPGDRVVTLSYAGDANFNPTSNAGIATVLGDAVFVDGFED